MTMRSIMTAALAVVATVGVATAGNADANPLVTAEWVEENLDNPKVRVRRGQRRARRVRARAYSRRAEHRLAHRSGRHGEARHRHAARSSKALVRKLGIDKDTTVVLYGDNNNWFAAWGAWVFSIYGLDNVKLLDGGRKKWELDKRAVVQPPRHGRGDASHARRAQPALRARIGDVLDVVAQAQHQRHSSTSARPTNTAARSSRRPARRSSRCAPATFPAP